ncbi:GDSL-type esterase/lipase family protein [Actinoplanes sp. NPDC049802]|uniref:GDSL-type esterase/lipase family protein n=1 Tax=Actinoplanes sp. NPDC049802 TaxID=3154742 RepID=UPI0033C50661
MADRRTFIRTGGLFATGVAVTGVAAEPVLASVPDQGLPMLGWHAALANRRYTPAVVAVIGSSSSEGVGSTMYGRGYVPLLADNLRAAFPVAGAAAGDNYTAAWGRPAGSWPVLLSGGARTATLGWGLKSADLRAAGQTATFTFTGTSVRVWHSAFPGGGAFAVTVDGVTLSTVDTGGPAVDHDAAWISPRLEPGRHTIVVTCVKPEVRLHGFAVFHGDEDRGVHVYSGGHGGLTSGDFADGAAGWAPRLRTVQPHLVILQLGVNDWRTRVPAATVKRNLKSIIATVRAHSGTGPSFVVYGSPRVSGGRSLQDFAQVTRAWQDVAAEDTGGPGGGSAVAFFDLAARQPAPSADNSLGLYCDDLVHMTDRGAAFTADALASFLSP